MSCFCDKRFQSTLGPLTAWISNDIHWRTSSKTIWIVQAITQVLANGLFCSARKILDVHDLSERKRSETTDLLRERVMFFSNYFRYHLIGDVSSEYV